MNEPAAGRGFALSRDRSFGYLLRDTSRLVLRALQEKIEAHGITLGQYDILRELWKGEGLTQRELSERVHVLEPATVSALDAMEKRNLVTRVRSRSDRRKINVFLTTEAKALRAELLAYAIDVNDRALSGFAPEEVEALRGYLRRVKRNLAGEDVAR